MYKKEGLWVLLHEAGIKGKLWRVLHNTLTRTSSRVTFEGAHSTLYEAINGVREGSVLSPTLFIIFCQWPPTGPVELGTCHQMVTTVAGGADVRR